jgi:RNA polymerase sigma-70 factor (ECF subfamily)
LADIPRESIDKLPAELGQAVIMRDLQDMSYGEMAKQLKVPLGTVKSRINRGRIELARRLTRRRGEFRSTREDVS